MVLSVYADGGVGRIADSYVSHREKCKYHIEELLIEADRC